MKTVFCVIHNHNDHKNSDKADHEQTVENGDDLQNKAAKFAFDQDVKGVNKKQYHWRYDQKEKESELKIGIYKHNNHKKNEKPNH